MDIIITIIGEINKHLNLILGSIASAIVIYSFIAKRKSLYFLLDDHQSKLYIENYELIKQLLCNKIANSKITDNDFDILNLAEHKAQLYLEKEIANYIRKIKCTFANLYKLQSLSVPMSNENKIKFEKELANLGMYRNNLENLYRPYLVKEGKH